MRLSRTAVIVVAATVALASGALTGCSAHELLNVPPPTGASAASALDNATGAEKAASGATVQLVNGIVGTGALVQWSELLSDEFVWTAFASDANQQNIDARRTAAGAGFSESGDPAFAEILLARSSLLLAIPALEQYATIAPGPAITGGTFALIGYAEVFLAEDYCAGVPLDGVLAGGGVHYGMPLTTDSLLGAAEAHFDSALAHTGSSDTVQYLASVGLGRTLLNRGRYDSAAMAVSGVPVGFVYNFNSSPTLGYGQVVQNLYAAGQAFGSNFNTGEMEGGTGLDFVTAQDPRLVLDSSLFQTSDGSYFGVAPGEWWYYPLKFGQTATTVPIATGLEAQLIIAEAALQAGQPGQWLTVLNTLRNSGCAVPGVDSTCNLGTGQVPGQTTGAASLADPGTDSGRVSLMFRERAFWLFGTGSRLGDLRRLVRQYGRVSSAVFPNGPYTSTTSSPATIPTYGTDVSLTLPTSVSGTVITNPNYRGCLNHSA